MKTICLPRIKLGDLVLIVEYFKALVSDLPITYASMPPVIKGSQPDWGCLIDADLPVATSSKDLFPHFRPGIRRFCPSTNKFLLVGC